jgi:hypothetical protein
MEVSDAWTRLPVEVSRHAMNDERDIDTEQTPKDTAAREEREAPQITEDDQPGVTDFLKAAKDGAKNLSNLEP